MPPLFSKFITRHPTKVNFCNTICTTSYTYHGPRRGNMLEEAHALWLSFYLAVTPLSPSPPVTSCYIKDDSKKRGFLPTKSLCSCTTELHSVTCALCMCVQPLGSSPLAIDAVLFSGGRSYNNLMATLLKFDPLLVI
jgi:hypothetical protein